MLNKFLDFIREVREEIKKITYPDKKSLRSATYFIIFIVFFIALYMELIDLSFKFLLNFLFKIY